MRLISLFSMRVFWSVVLLLSMLSTSILHGIVYAEPTPTPNPVPSPTMPTPTPPNLNARAYLLLDHTSGQIIAERNASDRVEPASLTKLMTAYLSFAAIKQRRITLEQYLPVSEHARKAEGSRMFIDMRKPVTVNELLHGMIIQSGNDAAITLAESIGGTEENFAQLMNQQAARLGMKNTHFMNATGLPNSQHYTTAFDLSLLAAAIINDFPEFYNLYSIKEYRYNNITQSNRNRLLWLDPYVDGMKTGHTDSAGFCLISSAKRQNRRLISVVLGTHSDTARATESQRLLNYGFQFFETTRLYIKDKPITELAVYKGKKDTVRVGFRKDIYLTLQLGQRQRLKAAIMSTKPLMGPITLGQRLGTVRIMLDNKMIAEYPVLALEEIEQASIFGRIWDSLRLMFQ